MTDASRSTAQLRLGAEPALPAQPPGTRRSTPRHRRRTGAGAGRGSADPATHPRDGRRDTPSHRERNLTVTAHDGRLQPLEASGPGQVAYMGAGIAQRDTAEVSHGWLRYSIAALAILAAAAAVVSWDAQYILVHAVKRVPAIAALEAGIPDAGALIFATLGIALALHGRRALRPRALNVACIAISLTMNALAAGRGWRDLAIWVLPAALYALASDTLIGVVRARALANMHAAGEALAGDDTTPLVVAGALLLWLLRLLVAPASTLGGFRRWVIEECPVAPGRKAVPAPGASLALVPHAGQPSRRRADGRLGKQDLLIALAGQRHDLQRLPLNRVARIAGEIGAEVDLHRGTARRVLRAHVLALQDGNPE